MKKQIILGVLLSLVSGLALAHPGHGFSGFASGFMHPLLGWDHLLMMVAVGVWAANMGGKARWQLPLTFVCTMLAGALLGAAGIVIGGVVESAIAAGLLALGLVLMTRFAVNRTMQLLFTALFALMHGLAHGVELSQGSRSDMMMPLLGMLLATAGLHGLGYMLGMQRHRLLTLAQALLAGLMLGLGANLLLTV